MKIGFAEVNITPPLGQQLPGYGRKPRKATGVKDELFAKAMVVESGGKVFALIAIDIISLDLEFTKRIRDRVFEHTGIQPESIMLSCTHTHTGPPRPVDGESLSYYPTFEAKVADAAILAYHRREEARIGYGRGYEDSIIFNRRYVMKDGTVKTNPTIQDPNIVKPEGPVDPEVIVIRVDNTQGEPIGIISNYALHTDCVGGTEYSGDYPAHISSMIKQLYGQEVVSLFLMGASGNINNRDVTGRIPRVAGRHIKNGHILGLEIAKVRNKTGTVDGDVKLSVQSRQVNAMERALMEHEIEEARTTLQALQDLEEEAMTSKQVMDKDRAENRLKRMGQPLSSRDYEIQVSVIGDLAIVALPAEMFVEFGLEIKEKSPYPYTIINELSNGSGNGYVCTQAAYERGGYETMGIKFSVEAGDQFVRAALDILHELHGA